MAKLKKIALNTLEELEEVVENVGHIYSKTADIYDSIRSTHTAIIGMDERYAKIDVVLRQILVSFQAEILELKTKVQVLEAKPKRTRKRKPKLVEDTTADGQVV